MHLTRFRFNAIVLVWLVPAIIMGIYGNTTTVGTASNMYYWWTLLSAVLAICAFVQCLQPNNTMRASEAQRRRDDPRDESVVSIGNINAFEYIYCGILVAVALGSFLFHFNFNKEHTGFLAMAAMIWSWLDLLVGGIAGWQFWRLKSGEIVAVTRQLISN